MAPSAPVVLELRARLAFGAASFSAASASAVASPFADAAADLEREDLGLVAAAVPVVSVDSCASASALVARVGAAFFAALFLAVLDFAVLDFAVLDLAVPDFVELDFAAPDALASLLEGALSLETSGGPAGAEARRGARAAVGAGAWKITAFAGVVVLSSLMAITSVPNSRPHAALAFSSVVRRDPP